MLGIDSQAQCVSPNSFYKLTKQVQITIIKYPLVNFKTLGIQQKPLTDLSNWEKLLINQDIIWPIPLDI